MAGKADAVALTQHGLQATVKGQVAQHSRAATIRAVGADAADATPEEIAELVRSGFLSPGDGLVGGGIYVPHTVPPIEIFGFAFLMARLLSLASPSLARQMAAWPLLQWVAAANIFQAKVPLAPFTTALLLDVATIGEDTRRPPRKVAPSAPSYQPAPAPTPVFSPPDLDLGPPEPAQVADRGRFRIPARPPTPPPPPSLPPSGPPPPPPPSGAFPMVPATPPGPTPPAWMGQYERDAWIQARRRAGGFCRGLGNRLDDDAETVVAEVWREEEALSVPDPAMREKLLEIIREETAQAVADGNTAQKLASRLGNRTLDWSRDWGRIAATELRGAMSDAVVIGAVREDGEDALIARVPEPTACRYCAWLFTRNGRPIIWTVTQLLEHGTNVGKRPPEWRPTLWPIHPWCQCDTVHVPRGFMFDDGWELVRDPLTEELPF